MTYNGRLLAKARDRLEEIRAQNSAEQQRRSAEVHRRLPAVRDIDARLRAQMIELVGLTIRRQGSGEAVSELAEQNLELQAHRAELLDAAGYAIDYTDDIYSCKQCKDSGMVGTEVCSCLQRLYNRELTEELGTLLRCGDEAFSKFDLTLYDAGPDRTTMELVFNTCVEYAKNFGPASPNLMFQGGTGLGKTFLSACIARVVAEAGFSVAYETASAALEAFELQKFSRDAGDAEAAAARVRQYLTCDLMILDDLGTEMVTTFSVSALYSIVNGRLINGKKTIISTNCTDEELRRKYSAQVFSRLEGEYLALPFVGRDIRLIRKERG